MSSLATSTGNSFITVDLDPIIVSVSVKQSVMSGEEWVKTQLPNISKRVSLVLMDGFDWTDSPIMVRSGLADAEVYNLISEYSAHGLVLNNIQSSMSHMIQILGLLPYFADRAVVMFTDTWFNYQLDTFEGKGAGAIYVLMAEGFHVISASSSSNYIMMGKNVSGTPQLPNLDQTVLNKIYRGPSVPPNQIMYINE